MERTTAPGVYRRGSRYVVIYRDPTGRQRQRSTRTLAAARALKAEITADIRRGEYREQSHVTFAAYAEEWMRTYAGRTSRGVRPATMHGYCRDLRLHVIPVLGARRLTEIEPRHVKLLAADLAAGGRRPSTVSPFRVRCRTRPCRRLRKSVARCARVRVDRRDGKVGSRA